MNSINELISITPSTKVFFYNKPIVMNKSFHGLIELTKNELKQDPESGHLYIFRNRKGDKIKVLFWDKTGYVIIYKVITALDSFLFPSLRRKRMELPTSQVYALLQGAEITKFI